MSVYEKWNSATVNTDIDACANLLHQDYIFVRHQTNSSLSKNDWISLAREMFNAMKEGKMKIISSRCIYENQDILVHHDVMSFPDGTNEAVMIVHKLKNGKIIKTETGASQIK